MNPGKRKRSPSEGENSRSQRPKFGGLRSDPQVDTVRWDGQQRQQQQHGGSALTDPREGRFSQTSAGPSTSRRAQHHRPPVPEEGVRWTAPHLRYILPATPLNGVAPTNHNGSTQGWNHHLPLQSGSAVGAGQVTSTLGGRVEPKMVSTPSLMSSQSSGQIATEDGQPDEDAVCLEHPYGGRIYCPPPSPEILQNTRCVRHEQQALDGACSVGPPRRAQGVGTIDSSAVYPYGTSPLAQPSAGHISRYSSLADALNLSLVRYNTIPSAPTLSPSSLSSSSSMLSSSSSSPSFASVLASTGSSPSTPTPSSSSLESAFSSSGHYPSREILDDVAAANMGRPDDIEASTRGDSAPMDCGTATGEDSIPQMSEVSSQENASSSVAPLSPSPSLFELASDIQISMSRAIGNIHVNYSPTLSSGMSSSPPPPRGIPNALFLSPRSIISASACSQSNPSPPQRRNAVPAIANHRMDYAVPDALPQTPNEEATDLRTTQQYDSTKSSDVHSAFTSSNSGASPVPAPSSSTSPSPTIPTAGSPSSSEPTSVPESHERVHDAALLAWLTRNINSAAFSGLIHRSFIVLPRTSASNIQMVHEAAQGHGIASEDVDEFVERVFSGAIELAALGNYGIRYEDLEWFIPKDTCSCFGPKQ